MPNAFSGTFKRIVIVCKDRDAAVVITVKLKQGNDLAIGIAFPTLKWRCIGRKVVKDINAVFLRNRKFCTYSFAVCFAGTDEKGALLHPSILSKTKQGVGMHTGTDIQLVGPIPTAISLAGKMGIH